MADMASITANRIGKCFSSRSGNLPVLREVTFSVGRGDFFCIVGPSGCGKTTLLRILAGLETDFDGDLTILPTTPSRPLNAMVFQEQSVFPWMTVRDNVAYGLRLRGFSKKDRYDIDDYFIRMIGLSKFVDCYPHQLSGGMKQRVSVARAFANDPEILLMDEPFGALDEQNRIILQQELLRIWEATRKTAVFITHSIDEALCLGDKIMVMTANPGTVKSIIINDLPRPRDITLIRSTPYYNQLYQTVWTQLRDEVFKGKESTI